MFTLQTTYCRRSYCPDRQTHTHTHTHTEREREREREADLTDLSGPLQWPVTTWSAERHLSVLFCRTWANRLIIMCRRASPVPAWELYN